MNKIDLGTTEWRVVDFEAAIQRVIELEGETGRDVAEFVFRKNEATGGYVVRHESHVGEERE